jgi:hypothetical protein
MEHLDFFLSPDAANSVTHTLNGLVFVGFG